MFILLILLFSINNSFSVTKVSVDTYIKKAGWTFIDGGFMDPETELIWGPEIEETSWGEAKSYCNNLELGQRKDWRLPTVRELQRSVCKTTGYPTRTSCPSPRDHEKDLWVLNKNTEKGITYWASDLIEGDPYNTYYFSFDVEGQHIITSKNDKSKARCVCTGNSLKAKTMAKDLKETIPFNEKTKNSGLVEKTYYDMYIAPSFGIGVFFNDEINIQKHFSFIGELRLGINTFLNQDKIFITGSVDTSLKARTLGKPIATNINIGPEFYIFDNLSVYAGLGLGIITVDTNFPSSVYSTIQTLTSYGLSWKAIISFQELKWDIGGKYRIPVNIIYSGITTNGTLSQIFTATIGLMYFI